ncbi:hypothetical protein ACTQX2_02085 [Megamonas funiformis]|jgi:hypothetical protein|uniref:hypothetical protein n=1 Tax=Megamonas funiformis TaxID=437897 RepID=UPI003F99CCCA
MKIIVYSKDELSELDKKRIKDIIIQSKCANESFRNTFNDRYSGMTVDNEIFFDNVTSDTIKNAIVSELEI